MWVLFAFGPYFFAEGLKLSGIMAVLFCGIVMSHYTHFNLSPVTQVTVQQTMRTVSFMAGKCVCRACVCACVRVLGTHRVHSSNVENTPKIVILTCFVLAALLRGWGKRPWVHLL